MSGLEYISVNQVFGGICSPPAETVRVPWGATKKTDCTVPVIVGLDYLKRNKSVTLFHRERERGTLEVDWKNVVTSGLQPFSQQFWI